MTPPFTIAHYQVTSKLGEGGMGAVYRANDTKLNRQVAIKILPGSLANDPDYLARFAREAQVLASLNHPNIAILHGVEDRALIMELVAGQTLEERIAGGPLPLDEALGIAAQIADALEAAHEKGVIHRDLKPANVKVTPEGVVKVLDFGLAKAAEAVSSAATANSPTLTIRATQAGIIMGTAGYMAPEQAAGKPVDRRADVWAFGVVLYELLMGRTLFTGETVSHTLASVLKDQIDLAAVDAPAPIRRLLARCLTRNPKDRLRDIGEARFAIREYLANPVEQATPAAVAAPARRAWLAWAICGVLALALAASVALLWRPAPAAPVVRFRVPLGDGNVFTSTGRGVLAISPDGTQVVYVANRGLHIRALSEPAGHRIPGAESQAGGGVTNPVFSPDGKSLAYYEGGSQTLKRIPVTGGAPVTLCDAPNLAGLTWDEHGLLFALSYRGVARVSPNGGQPSVVIPPKEGDFVIEPQMLPDGKTILLTVASMNLPAESSRWDAAQIVAHNLESGERKVLLEGGSSARYVPTGHLLYVQHGILFAAPFDPKRLEVTGAKVGMVEGIARPTIAAQFAVSANGSLVYITGPVTAAGPANRRLALVDRNGQVDRLNMEPGPYTFPRVSRDGRRIVFERNEGNERSVWVFALAEGTAPRRLTLPGSGSNRYPIWSADGDWVAFQSNRQSDLSIWRQRADGSGQAEKLTNADKGTEHIPDSWSPDGETLSYTVLKGNASEVWSYAVKARQAAVLAAEPGAVLGRSVFSPDGRWIAYQAAAQPNSRLYVRPFPPTATVYTAPEHRDAHHPLWSPDGKTLFFCPGPGQYGEVSFMARPTVTFGTPKVSASGFMTAIPGSVRTFDIMPDGKRFLGVMQDGLMQSSAAGSQFEFVLNWSEELKQRSARQ